MHVSFSLYLGLLLKDRVIIACLEDANSSSLKWGHSTTTATKIATTALSDTKITEGEM